MTYINIGREPPIKEVFLKLDYSLNINKLKKLNKINI